jgi:pimeloyl-ACP methyl ester carboxylesterase
MKNFLFICAILFASNTIYAQYPLNCIDDYEVAVLASDLDTLVSPVFTTSPPVTTKPPDSNRLVFWIHGLGGDAKSWSQAATASTLALIPTVGYPARKIYSTRVDYSKHVTNIQDATLRTYDEILNTTNNYSAPHYVVDTAKSMIISHSQGGIVSRTLDLLYDRPMYPALTHGIVTFGTPHEGAQILNNVSLIKSTLAQGCSELYAGPAHAAFDLSNPFLDAILDEEDIIPFLDTLLCFNLLPGAANLFTAQFESGTTKSFCNTCPFVDTLRNHKNFHSTHRVAFWGEEDDAELLRLLHYKLGKDNDVNANGPFTANYDSSLIMKFDTLYLNYEMKVIEHQQQYDFHKGSFWGGPFGGLVGIWYHNQQAQDALEKRDAYQRGINWMATLNDKWLAIIGGYQFDTLTYGNCQCEYICSPTVKKAYKAYLGRGLLLVLAYLCQQAATPIGIVTQPPPHIQHALKYPPMV